MNAFEIYFRVFTVGEDVNIKPIQSRVYLDPADYNNRLHQNTQ